MPYNKLPLRQCAGVLAISALFLVSACSEEQQSASADMAMPVSVVELKPQSVEISANLPGRVEAIKDAEIRARVTGIVTAINFEQGSEVEKGQSLFKIDPAQYQAARNQAEAQLQRAQADYKAAQALANRYARLIKANAISQQEYDNAIAQAGQAKAAQAAAKAALDSAEIDLGYTDVTSPISGRIGKSFVTEGALVSATQATLMASVQQIDKVYIDITRSTSQLAELRRALESGELKQSSDGAAQVTVALEDGSPYKHKGKLLFSGISVDPGTGQVSMRAEVSNPDQILLPGMYVRVSVQQGIDENALLVPDQAIQRGADGLNTVLTVVDEKVQPVAVSTGAKVNGKTVIKSGLEPGAIVIVEGFQKARPGSPVKPIPWDKEASGAGDTSNTKDQQTSNSNTDEIK